MTWVLRASTKQRMLSFVKRFSFISIIDFNQLYTMFWCISRSFVFSVWRLEDNEKENKLRVFTDKHLLLIATSNKQTYINYPHSLSSYLF